MYNYKMKLTERIFKRLQSQCSLETCARCGKKFDVGDVIVSHGCPMLKTERRYYHSPCWEEMYV